MRTIKIIALLMSVLTATSFGLLGCTRSDGNNNSSDVSSQTTSDTTKTNVTEPVNYEELSMVNVMSFNIYYKDVDIRAENVISLIKKYSADVLGMQEVSVEWKKHINKAFVDTAEYNAYGFGRYGADWSADTMQSGEQFSLILYSTKKFDLVDSGHFWCSSTPDIYSANFSNTVVSNYPRCINWVILKDKQSGDEFVFLNAHLDPENETVRIYSASLIVDRITKIADGRLCVLVGDWNSGLTKQSYLQITSNGFDDVRFTAEETTNIGTFNDWGKRNKNAWAFGDIIFASKGLAKTKKFDVVQDTFDGEYISDHCPVTAEIYY